MAHRFAQRHQPQKQVDAAKVRRDDCCAMGQWLHGSGGQRWGHLPTFTSLVHVHKQFHVEAGKVADVINQQRYSQAEAMLQTGTPYHQSSQQVITQARALRDEVESGKASPKAAAKPVRQLKAASPKALPAATDDEWDTF